MHKFQPSVNISYDFHKDNLLTQFVPNDKQLNIIQTVLETVTNPSEITNAHLLIGPYGAGKSMVGAIISNLMMSRRNGKALKGFYSNVAQINQEQSSYLENVIRSKEKRWIPVAIVGHSGKLAEVILQNTIKALKDEDISFSLKGEEEQIVQTIKNWRKNYHNTYSNLKDLCAQDDQSIDALVAQIKAGNKEASETFKKYYTILTSGATLAVTSSANELEQLEYILKQLKKQKIGLFITYDEFGRFLQLLDKASTYKAMQEMQDLAELSNRLENLGVLFITHSGLRQYAEKNSFSKSELERVEKRFRAHYLESDSSLFYRSAFKVLGRQDELNTPSLFLQNDIERYKIDITKFNLFPQMSSQEIDGTILEGCQPIHPLTIYLLPHLSNILGQNERTLYMFLAQFDGKFDETKWYYADELFDYFYSDETLYYRIEELKQYRFAVSYGVTDSALRLIKLLTLLENFKGKFAIKEDLISFALGISVDEAKAVIDELIQVKLLRYNRITNSYEMYTGSILELDELVQQYRLKIKDDDFLRAQPLKELIKNKYYLPLTYNSEKSMTRYIEVAFYFDVESISEKQTAADGELSVILSSAETENSHLQLIDHSTADNQRLFVEFKLDKQELVEKIDEYRTLMHMLSDKVLLKTDEQLESEIGYRMENLIFEIQQYLSPLENFSPQHLNWFYGNEKVKGITSRFALENFLSNWMSERFNETLEVRNEGFNKQKVSKVQRNAAVGVLDKLMKSRAIEGIEIDGFGPDYLIYVSILKNNQIDPFNLTNLNSDILKNMRASMLNYLETSDRGNLLTLMQVLQKEPYGMRKPIVPILTVALLKDYWHQLSFYANGLFVEEMNADLLYSILEQEASFYEFEFFKMDQNIRHSLLGVNETFFGNSFEEHPVQLFSNLRRWLRQLPRYTQITSQQAESIIEFKEIIRYSEIDPMDAATRLHKLVGQIDGNFSTVKQGLENHLTNAKHDLKEEALNVLGVREDLDEWIELNHDLISKNPILFDVVSTMEREEDWLVVLIRKTVGVRLEEWSDVTLDSFQSSLKRLLVVSDDEETIRIVTNDQTTATIQKVELSVKGKTVFNNVQRIVKSSGRTMQADEMKYILYKLLEELETSSEE
ncbi:hypothetical protein [Exiguobacterium sp. s26]|uniref:hypothetical protein n=1 Tax=Exiguobacterium sp. s26 TaxID=2751231 RepID=UPI001BEBF581|nr:hypothetical protein [Exiguobacterium sp. s26]